MLFSLKLQLTISDQPIEKMSNTVEPQDVDKTNQKQPEDDIRIEVIQEEDTQEVLAMLKEFFFKVRFFIFLNTSRWDSWCKVNEDRNFQYSLKFFRKCFFLCDF